MAMGRERSKALHNFTMPCGLRWGNQRFLRCMKVNSDGEISADQRRHRPIQQRRTTRGGDEDSFVEFLKDFPKVEPTPFRARRRFSGDDGDGDGDDGIAAMREKVMLDLQTAADKIKDAIFKDGFEEGEVSAPPPPPPPQTSADADGEAHCPWNLRTRRASSRTAASGFVSSKNGGPTAAAATGGTNDVGGGKTSRIDAPPRPNSGSSQMRATADLHHKLPMHKSDGNAASAAAPSGEKREPVKFSLPLSKREIEEDFFAMVGHRPPRRPKKRARTVQKQLDTLFPGLTLTSVTPDKYKVDEAAS